MTPEEAARGDIPARFVRVVGVVIRGDTGIVAQLTNDGPYEVETAYVHRTGDGWSDGSSGNSTSGWLAPDTFVVWDEAPDDAVAAIFEHRGDERRVAVEDGCAFTWFDGVSEREAYLDGPRLAGWVHADGSETCFRRHAMSTRMRAKLEEWLDR
jgi:hypothetical protein